MGPEGILEHPAHAAKALQDRRVKMAAPVSTARLGRMAGREKKVMMGKTGCRVGVVFLVAKAYQANLAGRESLESQASTASRASMVAGASLVVGVLPVRVARKVQTVGSASWGVAVRPERSAGLVGAAFAAVLGPTVRGVRAERWAAKEPLAVGASQAGGAGTARRA